MRITIAVLAFFASLAQAGVLLDDFNRADANNLGSNWTPQNGNAQISGNEAEALNGASSANLVTFNNYSSQSVSVDVANVGTGIQYIALDLGFANLANNYFIKVQNNGVGGAAFDTYAFYYGNNGTGSGPFANLDTPFDSGTITATLSGTSVTLNIIPTSGTPQTYTYDYGMSSGGSGIGLGFYGTALADNFTDALPEPATFALLGLGLAGIALVGKAKQKR